MNMRRAKPNVILILQPNTDDILGVFMVVVRFMGYRASNFGFFNSCSCSDGTA